MKQLRMLIEWLGEKGFVSVGDMMISLAAMPIQDKGMVNTLRVTEITTCNFK